MSVRDVRRSFVPRESFMMKYFVLIHVDEQGGYWGECPELPGCFSQGETANELMSNMKEAIELYLEGEEQPAESDRISEVRELVLS
ncbi:MAG: type II toxin-antitoxin system HicB family antitoxin [Synergistaceae bacterium]|jgi:predicted RNase H-like HicB family nuclease|nr:type II toxin-antitoxin system HicB family antitoxin [Synergistaceae bacterium]